MLGSVIDAEAHLAGLIKQYSLGRIGQSKDISDAVNEIERLTGRQTRLRENIKSGGQDELTSRWRTELDEAEQAIREIEEQRLPGLRKKERSLQSKVRDALKSLSAEWSEEAR